MKIANVEKLVGNLHEKKKASLKPCTDINTELRKMQKMVLEKIFSSRRILQFWKKLLRLRGNIEISIFQQRKREDLFCIRAKLWCNKLFFRKCISNRNKKTRMLMNKPVYWDLLILEITTKPKLRETKVWRKSEMKVNGHRQLCSLHKNRRHLHRYCRRCWKKIWHFRLLVRQAMTKSKKYKSNWINEK